MSIICCCEAYVWQDHLTLLIHGGLAPEAAQINAIYW
jgi:hypothetical protein